MIEREPTPNDNQIIDHQVAHPSEGAPSMTIASTEDITLVESE